MLIKKKLITLVLCGQCKVNHYPVRQTAVSVLSIIFHQRLQSIKTPVFARKHLSNRFAPYFLFSGKDLIKYLPSMLIPIIDVQVLTDVTITSSVAKNM